MKSTDFPRSRKLHYNLLTFIYVCVTAIIRLRLVSKGQERFVSMQQCSAVSGGLAWVLLGSLDG